MFGNENDASRRQFLQALGIGVAGMWGSELLATTPAPLDEHHQPTHTCDPPAHGAASSFIRDCRPIRPRQIADRLTPAEVTQLKAAYKAMRDLDTSDPNDPRGFRQQANVHCFFCATSDPSIQVHGTWKFFAWHRAYLYFHERILGKLIGNENFRLPFWGWDSTAFHKLPVPYVTPNDATNPLFNPTRALAPGTPLPDSDVGSATIPVIADVLSLATFAEFGGTASTSGVPEGSPHGSVHVDVGGDMGFFDTAGRDPIFYQHHGTVDKLWSDWNRAAATHTNPADPAFLNLTFNFFDENKVWRSIKASQVLDHENSLRYVYEPYRFWDIFRCFRWRPVAIGWRTTQRITLPPANRDLGLALRGDGPVRLHFREIQFPRDRTAVYDIYVSQEEAQAARGAESPGWLASVGIVLNDRENKHPVRGTANVIASVRPQLRARLMRGDTLQPYFVERSQRPASRSALPVRAADVFFSVGEMDRER